MNRLLPTLALCLAGCGEFPRDAHGTLDQVRAGRPLRVGWSVAEPQVRRGGPDGPAGVEPDLVRRWARGNGVRIAWTEAGEAQLVEALGANELDVTEMRWNSVSASC